MCNYKANKHIVGKKSKVKTGEGIRQSKRTKKRKLQQPKYFREKLSNAELKQGQVFKNIEISISLHVFKNKYNWLY